MSDTPRTDAMIYPTQARDPVTGELVDVVHIDDCRRLERDLREACDYAFGASPEDVALVPREPTEQMLDEGYSVWVNMSEAGAKRPDRLAAVYRAMVDAATRRRRNA
jgi:hypothetical protein